MLNLEPGVHLEEVKVLLFVAEELNSSGRGVSDGPGEHGGLGCHFLPGLGGKEGRWRLLNDLLVPPLDTALPFREAHDVVVLRSVSEELNFYMVRPLNEFLDEDPVIAKGGPGLVGGEAEALLSLLVVPGDPHALSPPTRASLDHDRVSNLVRDLDGLLSILDDSLEARDRIDAGINCNLLGLNLVSHGFDGPHRGAHKSDTVVLTSLPKDGVLTEETIPRVNVLGPG
mmetsp:Transcript_15269/g.31477  ORF Transcript_15269/g.31477 Transcript_15269/m.31477 type:complete len:228 (-) Transcript_15269:300-983(-)